MMGSDDKPLGAMREPLTCKGACELEAAHRAGDKVAEVIERHANAEIDSLRNQRNLLAQALGELLVALGVTESWSMSGPELLVSAQEATKALKGKESACTGITATYCPLHGDCTCPRPTSNPNIDPLEYLNSGGCPLHSPSSKHGEVENNPCVSSDCPMAGDD